MDNVEKVCHFNNTPSPHTFRVCLREEWSQSSSVSIVSVYGLDDIKLKQTWAMELAMKSKQFVQMCNYCNVVRLKK